MSLTRKFLFFLIISLIIAGFTGTYALYAYRQNQRKPKQNIKAPEQNITLIEGWAVRDIASYLDKKKLINAPDFLTLERNFDVSDYSLLKSKPAGADLEGFLFPDTYKVPLAAPTSSQDQAKLGDLVIKKMLDNFTAKFTPQMQQQAKNLDMSVYQIVTMASIIEKETGRNATTAEAKQQLQEERGMVAGIFYNRLNAGMPLQSDATINYITKKNDPAASAQDLSIDSPYNTYKYKGLPPGPICNPSLSSIEAALNPTPTDYFYFLHNQQNGQIIYSKTFEEHLKNKAKYLK